MVETGTLAINDLYVFRYLSINRDGNMINWKGCAYLSDCDWPKLKVIVLSVKYGIHEMAQEGCMYVLKSNWKVLKNLRIGNCHIM
jgi:hypothetical protein